MRINDNHDISKKDFFILLTFLVLIFIFITGVSPTARNYARYFGNYTRYYVSFAIHIVDDAVKGEKTVFKYEDSLGNNYHKEIDEEELVGNIKSNAVESYNKGVNNYVEKLTGYSLDGMKTQIENL